MKMNEQQMINNECIDAYRDLQNCINSYGANKVANLRTCNAEVWETVGYTFLKSYNTIVACIGDFDDVCYDFLRYVYGYTATSAQHINKFCQDYYAESVQTYRPL